MAPFHDFPISAFPKGMYDGWDDLSNGTGSIRVQGSGVSADFTNIGFSFPTNNIFPDDFIYNNVQLRHKYKLGSPLAPHIHFIQNSANIPNWVMNFRVYNNGEVIPSFRTVKWSALIFPYTSGSILQIATFPDITQTDNATAMNISCNIDYKISRDTSNASTLFTGVDANISAALLKYFDIHELEDNLGSRQMATK